jgi:hypothetical protein
MTIIHPGFQTPFTFQLSFEQVIEQYKKNHLELNESDELLDEISKVPELSTGISELEFLHQHRMLIQALLKPYFAAELTDNEIKAVGLPFSSQVFNLSRRFQSILDRADKKFDFNIRDFDPHQLYIMSCCIVLNRFYGTNLDFGKPLFYDIPTANGIIKHYRILYNADYLEVIPTEKSVPLNPEDIEKLINNYQDLQLWKRLFPEGSYLLRGFSIMTLYDATVENAVSMFKGKLLDFDPAQFQQSMRSIFASIFSIPDLSVGYVLLSESDLESNNDMEVDGGHSIVIDTGSGTKESSQLCNRYHDLLSGKQYFCIANIQHQASSETSDPFLSALKERNFGSLILAPVRKHGRILGVLEVASPRKAELNSINANKLDIVMPHFTDKLDKLAAELENNIQAQIQMVFTTLHPSVNWKFRSLAKKQLRNMNLQSPDAYAEEVVFDQLMPMYGQIDVQGSSEIRNSSVQKDLLRQLKWVQALLVDSMLSDESPSTDHIISQLAIFVDQLNTNFEVSSEQVITTYLNNTVHPQLLQNSTKAFKKRILRYLDLSIDKEGVFHHYRRKYDHTIQSVNQALLKILDERQKDAQVIFPHYFERFKTDGIDHTLYLGQSIAPHLSYTTEVLDLLRLWQLRTMCQMEATQYTLRPFLRYPVKVTSLILVYNAEIAIRFRMDEKRFDVDGTYNARFEMVKKRIDKATIKHTGQRITQAGKLTIVFTSERDVEQYLQYIHMLQQEKILSLKIEFFDLEDLQGMKGLKGIRVALRRH